MRNNPKESHIEMNKADDLKHIIGIQGVRSME